MDMIDFECPHCGKTISVTEQYIGHKGRCTHCQGVFMIALLEPGGGEDSNIKGDGDRKLPYDPDQETSQVLSDRVREDLQRQEPSDNVLDVFFAYEEVISEYYRTRDTDPFAVGLCIQACMQQIGLTPVVKKVLSYELPGQPLPRHNGYATLASIREKQGRYDEVVRVCLAAKTEGWAGDWEPRINRCRKTYVLHKAR